MDTHIYIFAYLSLSHYCLAISVMFLKKILLHLAVLSGKERTECICICFSTWPGCVPFRGAFMPTNRSPWGTGLGDRRKKRIREQVSPQKLIHAN